MVVMTILYKTYLLKPNATNKLEDIILLTDSIIGAKRKSLKGTKSMLSCRKKNEILSRNIFTRITNTIAIRHDK